MRFLRLYLTHTLLALRQAVQQVFTSQMAMECKLC